MERPSAPPLGAATQSTGRSMIDTPASTRPPLPNTGTVRKVPSLQDMLSNGSMSNQISISAAQVVALAKEAMRNALEENQTKAGGTNGMSNELKPGITIDMSHKNIQRFPEEVVDIIKTELERYIQSIGGPNHD